MQLIASVIGTLGVVVLAVIGTAFGLTLFFRRNPAKQAEVNKVVDSAAKKL